MGYATAMRRYFQISGRSSGYEFWMFTLFYLIFGAIAAAIDVRLLGHPLTEGTGVAGGIVALIHFVPSITVGIRRLHDSDRSGFWMLLILLPLIGIIWLIVLWCFGGTLGNNGYGPPHDYEERAPAEPPVRSFRSSR